MSPSNELELLPSELSGADPGGANNLTCFGVFGVGSGGAASGGHGGYCSGCWNGSTNAVSGGKGGLLAGLGST